MHREQLPGGPLYRQFRAASTHGNGAEYCDADDGGDAEQNSGAILEPVVRVDDQLAAVGHNVARTLDCCTLATKGATS